VIVLKVDMLVKAGTEEKCKTYLRLLAEHSSNEPGCLMYFGHQSIEDPRKFLIYERYQDQAALEAHRNSPHFAQYVRGGLDTLVESRNRELFHALD
jgi:(4S)-4-hydroxy-5-phosphonooxypentane-2,3-dione isomerase